MDTRRNTISKRMLFTVACTFAFGFAAHAFRFFGTAFSHDSTYLYQDMAAWQISLGRFLQPVYLLLRGKLCVPYLIGMFSLVWLAAGICVIIHLLDIKSKVSIALICGILSVNAVLSLSFASYLPWCDIFTLSFFLSVLSVYLQRRFRFGFLYGTVPLAAALALYQSYFETAVFLSLILLIKDCFDGLERKQIIVRALKALSSLLLSLLLYYVCLRVVLSATQIDLTTAANGITGVGDYSSVPILHLIKKTYLFAFESYLNPPTFHPTVAAVLNIAVMLFSLVWVYKISIEKKLPKRNIIFLSLFLLAIPFGMNVVYFISKGFKHELMTFSFYLLFVLALFLQDYSQANPKAVKADAPAKRTVVRLHVSRYFLMVCVGLLVLNNIIFANHLYLKKQLEYETTLATLTRVIDRMEQTDGYIVGQTPVAIIGSLNDSQITAERPGFDYIDAIGMSSQFSVTYVGTYAQFFQNVLGYPINLIINPQILEQLAESMEVLAMPSFPNSGCCTILDGTLIMKLS